MKKSPPKDKSKRSFIGWIWKNVWMMLGFGVILCFSGYGILSQTAKEPPSYYQELLPPAPKIEENANQAISKVEKLNQQLSSKKAPSKKKTHSIHFTQHEINAWLKTRWLASRSEAEKKVLKEVRIRLTPDQITAVAHLETRLFEGFLTTECRPTLADNQTLEIQLIKCYSGLARIPISQVRKRILSRIPDNFPNYRWPEGSSVISIDLSGLVTAKEHRPVVIEKIEVVDGSIEIHYRIR